MTLVRMPCCSDSSAGLCRASCGDVFYSLCGDAYRKKKRVRECMFVTRHVFTCTACGMHATLTHTRTHMPAPCFTLVVFKLFIHKCIVHVHVCGH